MMGRPKLYQDEMIAAIKNKQQKFVTDHICVKKHVNAEGKCERYACSGQCVKCSALWFKNNKKRAYANFERFRKKNPENVIESRCRAFKKYIDKIKKIKKAVK